MRGLLLFVGIKEGSELAGDVVQIATPLPGGLGADPAMVLPMGGTVVSSWEANGVTFYRLADGRLATQNKHGRWKVWRPKRPVVLHRTGPGARDLGTLLEADAVLQKGAKRIARMLRARGYAVTRKGQAGGDVYIEKGSGDIIKVGGKRK